jgi:hypothetical protein
MSRIVTEAEAAFLAMIARRTLRFQREAEARGEKYHDITQPHPLTCGHSAKLIVEPVAHGYEPVVVVKLKEGTPLEVADQMARDILGSSEVVSMLSPQPEGLLFKFGRKP